MPHSVFGWSYPPGCSGPPDEDEPCQICHQFDCICPECEVCGVAGDPACINTHMPWQKWGHFSFAVENKQNDYVPSADDDWDTFEEEY